MSIGNNSGFCGLQIAFEWSFRVVGVFRGSQKADPRNKPKSTVTTKRILTHDVAARLRARPRFGPVFPECPRRGNAYILSLMRQSYWLSQMLQTCSQISIQLKVVQSSEARPAHYSMTNHDFVKTSRRENSYPFTAIVGQEEMKLALLLNAVDPLLGGVLIMGHRGTGKSTAVRSLARLLPEIPVVADCPYRCDPNDESALCANCVRQKASREKLKARKRTVEVIDLPLGATEDRVCGTIDIERALKEGKRSFEPGLLARANRGFLYIDEVNLLDDHLVDLLLDVAVTGINHVERESISVEHPARFVLVGSGNPEEGELRPQLLDRFALSVEVTTENDVVERVEVVERHSDFDRDPQAFQRRFDHNESQLRGRIKRGRTILPAVVLPREVLLKIAALCSDLKLDGHRGELTLSRASRAFAALSGRRQVKLDDVKQVAQMSLRHRLRRQPFDEDGGGSAKIDQALEKIMGETKPITKSRKAVESGVSENGRSASTESYETSDPGSKPSKTRVKSLPDLDLTETRRDGLSNTNGRYRRSLNRETVAKRGRYARAILNPGQSKKLALDATLRAIAASSNTTTPADALRYKQFTRRAGSLFIFVVDTSGSMALRRIERARELAINLLRRAYLHRDSVAIVSFRGTSAEEVLPPCRSIVRARRALDAVAVGGGTPLSAGVARALEIAKRSGGAYGQPTLVLFTDGGANVSLSTAATDRSLRAVLIAHELRILGAELRAAQIAVNVIGTTSRFGSSDAQLIAEQLGATYFGS